MQINAAAIPENHFVQNEDHYSKLCGLRDWAERLQSLGKSWDGSIMTIYVQDVPGLAGLMVLGLRLCPMMLTAV
jgi:hypothetical protein